MDDSNNNDSLPDEIDASGRNPAIQQIVRWFNFQHLTNNHARVVSAIFFEIVVEVLDAVHTDGPEVTAGLRKLLEAKDCFVRAAIDDDRL